MGKSNKKIAMTVSWNTIIGNVILFAFKMVAGIIGHSVAMISDAIHSLSDVLSTIIVMIGIKLANKEADKEHPYGHERFESVAAIILAGILVATGIGIGYKGIQTIFSSDYSSIIIPSKIALIAAIMSIIVKEAMYWYTRNVAKKINSGALMADAWHHRSDALSSIGSFIGILGSQIGFPVMDSVASLVISFFIIKVSVDIFKDAISKMTDQAVDEEIEKQIYDLALAREGVMGVDKIKTRMFGDKVYVDIEIKIDRLAPLHISHGIAHDVHDAIEKEIPNIKHCMVHVNPDSE
ncbi:MAG TPA: cation diffusion facilitator family transporter [Thermoclostridium sp.]|nr:cation diffusion facilitator family transporter [Thermoclostridium sp.]